MASINNAPDFNFVIFPTVPNFPWIALATTNGDNFDKGAEGCGASMTIKRGQFSLEVFCVVCPLSFCS